MEVMPVGMEPAELAAYYAEKYPLTFVRRFSESDDKLNERYQTAWKWAQKAAAILKNKYGAKQVKVFGSLVDRSRFTPWSDIDLAAWGIPDNRFYAAVGAVTALTPDFKIDLVDPETCRDAMCQAINSEGLAI
jgi:predicted nucleotidyltransferase